MIATLKAALIAAALSLPAPHASDESPEAYRARVETIATAIATVTDSRPLAFALLVLTHAESGFALEVHDGRRTGDRGRSRCVAQIQPSGLVPRHEWARLTGTDLPATIRCIRAAERVLTSQARRCVRKSIPTSPGDVARAFMGYGTGGGCTPAPWAWQRARRWARLLAWSYGHPP